MSPRNEASKATDNIASQAHCGTVGKVTHRRQPQSPGYCCCAQSVELGGVAPAAGTGPH